MHCHHYHRHSHHKHANISLSTYYRAAASCVSTCLHFSLASCHALAVPFDQSSPSPSPQSAGNARCCCHSWAVGKFLVFARAHRPTRRVFVSVLCIVHCLQIALRCWALFHSVRECLILLYVGFIHRTRIRRRMRAVVFTFAQMCDGVFVSARVHALINLPSRRVYAAYVYLCSTTR